MKPSRALLAVLVAGALSSTPVAAQEKGGTDDFGPYEVVSGWSKPVKQGYVPTGAYAVYAESPSRIIATYVGERPAPQPRQGGGPAPAPAPVERHMVVVYDGTGKV